jgi:hypothetical protein
VVVVSIGSSLAAMTRCHIELFFQSPSFPSSRASGPTVASRSTLSLLSAGVMTGRQ